MYQFGASWGSSSRTHEAEIDLKTVARHAVETGQLKPGQIYPEKFIKKGEPCSTH
jgi:hypothetical protein|tara:strand:+ start:461 stop:625 length:165 start_codon:yes stop_codon:yes gene_type:complete